jgi:hypothetical protein
MGNSDQPVGVRVASLRYYQLEIIPGRDLRMMKTTLKFAAVLMTTAVLATAVTPAAASGQLPIFKACLAEAEKAADPKVARDQCVWDHWDLMAEYG